MSVKYKVISTITPASGKENKRYYFPRITGSSKINLRQISRIIEKRSTASEADVTLVLTSLTNLIPELLAQGNTINLGEFGSFRLHAKTKSADSPENVTDKNIKELNIKFRPGNRLKEAIKKVKFEKEE